MTRLYTPQTTDLILQTRHTGVTIAPLFFSEETGDGKVAPYFRVLLPPQPDNLILEFLQPNANQKFIVESVQSSCITYAPHASFASRLYSTEKGAFLRLFGLADQWFAVSNIQWNWE